MNVSNHPSVISELWLSCSKPNPQSKLRLFCFPYAGAGASMFNVWSNFLMPEVELFLIHLPGRDRRIKEPLSLELDPVVKALADALGPWLDKPFVFFGHSMGALLSFALARQIRRQYSVQPGQLFISGRQPPHIPDPNPEFRDLPEDEFFKTTQHYYGELPEIILQDQEVLQLFLKIMRADLTMIETFAYRPEPPLDCPIYVFGGLHDPSTNETRLAAWQEQTTAAFKLQMFPGHHFFIQSSRAPLLKILNDELLQLMIALEGKGSLSDGNLSQ